VKIVKGKVRESWARNKRRDKERGHKDGDGTARRGRNSWQDDNGKWKKRRRGEVGNVDLSHGCI